MFVAPVRAGLERGDEGGVAGRTQRLWHAVLRAQTQPLDQGRVTERALGLGHPVLMAETARGAARVRAGDRCAARRAPRKEVAPSDTQQ